MPGVETQIRGWNLKRWMDWISTEDAMTNKGYGDFAMYWTGYAGLQCFWKIFSIWVLVWDCSFRAFHCLPQCVAVFHCCRAVSRKLICFQLVAIMVTYLDCAYFFGIDLLCGYGVVGMKFRCIIILGKEETQMNCKEVRYLWTWRCSWAIVWVRKLGALHHYPTEKTAYSTPLSTC